MQPATSRQHSRLHSHRSPRPDAGDDAPVFAPPAVSRSASATRRTADSTSITIAKSLTGRPPKHSIHGQSIGLDDLAHLAGVGRSTMARRLLTMSPEQAVELGPLKRKGAPRYRLNGRPHTVDELAAMAGCRREAMRSRLDYGMTPEAAVAAGANIRHPHRLNGEPIGVAELARIAGCSKSAMHIRLNRRGLTPEQAVADNLAALTI